MMEQLKIRQLKFDDVYLVAAILEKVPLELSQADVDALATDWMRAGIGVIKNLIGHSPQAKSEINNFLGSLFDISGEDFGDLNFVQVASCMKQLKELEGLSDFLDAVSQLIESK